MICKNVKSFFGENSLNVTNVKLFSKFFFGNLGVLLMPFCNFFNELMLRAVLMVCYFLLLEKGP